MTESEAKRALDGYIASWLTQDRNLFLDSLSESIVYSESYGPIYRNKSECAQWFDEWNKDSQVTQWEIRDFAFDPANGKIAFEWFFECDYKGNLAGFDGCSFMILTDRRFSRISEYKTDAERYYPYGDDKIHARIHISKARPAEYTLRDTWPNAEELALLLRQSSWAKNRTADELSTLSQGSDAVVSAYAADGLIGFGRLITDGKYRGLLDDIIVDEKHRSHGIGSDMVTRLMDRASGVEEVFLNTGKDHQAFYERLGFRPFEGLTMVRRK